MIRSDNLRAAPRWITPQMVKGVLELAPPTEGKLVPVKTFPTRGVTPKLEIVPPVQPSPDDHDDYPGEVNDRVPKPPATHSRRSKEREAANRGPTSAASPPRPTDTIREVEKTAPRRPAAPSPSREPALHAPQQARAHTLQDRDRHDRIRKRRIDATRRANLERAGELLDAGKTVGQAPNVHIRLAMREVESLRVQEHRLNCPIEQAKTLLRRRYAPVCSMAVYDGDPDLFMVGSKKDVTRAELLAMAARIAA
jgi:hypothetical protein